MLAGWGQKQLLAHLLWWAHAAWDGGRASDPEDLGLYPPNGHEVQGPLKEIVLWNESVPLRIFLPFINIYSLLP